MNTTLISQKFRAKFLIRRHRFWYGMKMNSPLPSDQQIWMFLTMNNFTPNVFDLLCIDFYWIICEWKSIQFAIEIYLCGDYIDVIILIFSVAWMIIMKCVFAMCCTLYADVRHTHAAHVMKLTEWMYLISSESNLRLQWSEISDVMGSNSAHWNLINVCMYSIWLPMRNWNAWKTD